MASLAIVALAAAPALDVAYVQSLSRTGIAICQIAALDAWAEQASEGETFLYAKGCGLPKWSKVPGRVRVLSDAGLVTMRQRHHSEFDTDYIVRRTDAPWVSVPAADARVSAGSVDRMAEDRRREAHANALLALLRSAAELQAPCPSNAWLAGRIDCSEPRVVRLFDLLEERHQIRRTATAWEPGRIVAIVGTTLETGTDGGGRTVLSRKGARK